MSEFGDETCAKCTEDISTDSRHMTCCACSGLFHLGSCSGVSEKSFKSKGEDYKKSWKCPQCRKAESNAQCLKGADDTSVAALLLEMNRKLDELLPLKKMVHDLEASVKLMSDKYDVVLVDVVRHDGEIKCLADKVSKLEKTGGSAAELERIASSVNDLEYQSRKLNLEVHGVRHVRDECLLTEMNAIASKLNLDMLNDQSISAIHRLPARADKIPGIIIRFANQMVRDKWLEKRKLFPTVQSGLYVMENLTTHNRFLLKKAKEWAKANNFRFVWHRGGKILIRKEEGNTAHVVKNAADLNNLK